MPNTEPVVNQSVANNANAVTPIVEDNKILEEVTPVEDDKFDKTEIIDFSSLEPTSEAEKPIDIKPINFTPFVVDQSQFGDTDNILNGETSSNNE
jgi:hypothetical protein